MKVEKKLSFLVFTDDMEELYIGGCSSGIDWEVIHENGFVKIKMKVEKKL
jgi:hypothetical protein